MSSLADITLMEWILGGGLVALFCGTAWILLRACHSMPVNDSVSVDFRSLKRRS